MPHNRIPPHVGERVDADMNAAHVSTFEFGMTISKSASRPLRERPVVSVKVLARRKVHARGNGSFGFIAASGPSSAGTPVLLFGKAVAADGWCFCDHASGPGSDAPGVVGQGRS
jgi:hypothetical protein